MSIKFPYSDFHELNLNWILNQVKSNEDNIETLLENAVIAKRFTSYAQHLKDATLSDGYVGVVFHGTITGIVGISFIACDNGGNVTITPISENSSAVYVHPLSDNTVQFRSTQPNNWLLWDILGKSSIYDHE